AVDGDAGEREKGHRVGQRALHSQCVTSYVGAEEGTSDDREGGSHGERKDVDLLVRGQRVAGTERFLRHHLSVVRDTRFMEGGLEGAALAAMLLVLAGEESAAEKRPHHLRAAVLVE